MCCCHHTLHSLHKVMLPCLTQMRKYFVRRASEALSKQNGNRCVHFLHQSDTHSYLDNFIMALWLIANQRWLTTPCDRKFNYSLSLSRSLLCSFFVLFTLTSLFSFSLSCICLPSEFPDERENVEMCKFCHPQKLFFIEAK